MKNKFLTILKTNLINTYKLKAITKKKLILILILASYIAVSIFMMLNEFFTNVYQMFDKVNLSNYYLTIVFSITMIFSFFFTIFSAKNALFENRDNDLLFSLPIKKKTILLSRISSILIYNFILGLFIIAPGLYVYIINIALTPKIVIIITLLTLFSSIIPTILASLFGYLIALITSKSKKKNIIELISYTVFIAIYMIAIYKGDLVLKLFIDNPDLLTKVLKYMFFPVYLINLSITSSNPLYIISYIALNIAVIYLFITLLNKKYYKIIINLKNQKTSSNFKLNKTKITSPRKALIKKEINRYFGSAIYVFNTAFGVIILLIASIASIFYTKEKLISLIGTNIDASSFMLVFYLLLFVIGFSVTTNSSISIERNNFWILKMLPIHPKEVFRAKKSVNLLLLIPAITISLIIFRLSNYITYTEMTYLLILSIVASFLIANFGLICNLLFPKLDAQNDTVIIKQSMSSLLGIITPLITLIIYIIIIDSLKLTQNSILILTIIIISILLICTQIILNTWGVKKYKKLS